jgi:hypothetical protein
VRTVKTVAAKTTDRFTLASLCAAAIRSAEPSTLDPHASRTSAGP